MAKKPTKGSTPEIVDDDPLGLNVPKSDAAENAPAVDTATTSDATASDVSEASTTGSAVDAGNDSTVANGATASGEDEPAPPAETSTAETPPAPGEDAETVFDRRLQRLYNIVAEAEFESGTALGDIIGVLLELFKHRPKLWSAMSQSEQRDAVKQIEMVAKTVLEKTVLALAQEEFRTIEATMLPAFTVKGEAIEGKFKIDHADRDLLTLAWDLAGHRVVIINADMKGYSARRKTTDPTEPDQREIPFSDPPKAVTEIRSDPPNPPSDDSDLADDDSSEEDGEPETSEDDQFGVYDEARGEWLIDDKGGDDGWTTAVADAGRWPHGAATDIGRAFDVEGEPPLVVRRLDPKPESETVEG